MIKHKLELNYGDNRTVNWAIFEQDDIVSYLEEISKFCRERKETISAKDINWIKITREETPFQSS